MEEKSREFNSNSTKSLAITMNFLRETLSPLSSDPLFSTIITLYTLILLYFPKLFLRIIFSPVLISTGILFLTVLRLGAIQRTEKDKDKEKGYDFLQPPPQPTDDSINEDHKWVSCKSNTEPEIEMGLCLDFDPCHFYVDSFIEWNVRAPLEVIYEGEEDENDESSCEKRETQLMGIEKYASLSLYYPETDSDSSTEVDFPVDGDWDSPADMCFSWAEEDREGLIEIALDGKKETEAFFHAEEENLIEIDISPATSNEFSGEKW